MPDGFDAEDKPLERALGVLLAIIGCLAFLDIVVDFRHDGWGPHIYGEALIIAIALFAVGLLVRTLLRRQRMLHRDLSSMQAEAMRWRAEAQSLLRGLGASLDTQFTRWDLTGAEKETALLLLKGCSHKEIAAHRGITDATARQQATAVYRKAGLTGRRELAAFFLEELALPPDAGPPSSATDDS
ncbi:MAG: LuxR family transcriptional regulator [Pseudomonadales bacterium]|nr:LuxR family transcriptional regulator [Pseudomonadales bacterium]MCP5185560.1 LuxR family transcriptional regulator [Pseudomonadales bacterium]